MISQVIFHLYRSVILHNQEKCFQWHCTGLSPVTHAHDTSKATCPFSCVVHMCKVYICMLCLRSHLPFMRTVKWLWRCTVHVRTLHMYVHATFRMLQAEEGQVCLLRLERSECNRICVHACAKLCLWSGSVVGAYKHGQSGLRSPEVCFKPLQCVTPLWYITGVGHTGGTSYGCP